ncbi:MAG: hypothetical protein EB078_08135, partial [Proteobacteria bacterium]|nr:hypothetical protein [Pseudomonadota bacterium]
KTGTVPTTDKEKALAAKTPPADVITHGDILKARGASPFNWKGKKSELPPESEFNSKKISTGTVYSRKYEEVEMDESIKTTHENPLVTVHDKNGLHTHANLSVANDIFGTDVKPSDVHKGEVKTKSRAGDIRFNISKHHEKAMKEEVVAEDMEKYIKQAAGIAKDKRYAGGNMTGAMKVIRKLKPGLENHPKVQAALKKANESTDTPGNSYEHQCAIHVKSEQFGEGRTITTQHADPDHSGNIAWYDVMFEHGIEKKVPTEALEILVSESHMHSKKKKAM